MACDKLRVEVILFTSCSLLIAGLSNPAIGLVAKDDAIPSSVPLSSPPARKSDTCDPDTFKIAVDVGHTPEAQGATSARGVTEFTFNSVLAKRIGDKLKEAGYLKAYILTTTGIGKRQLESRVAQANSLGVDLFLSIHHDDVQPIYYSMWRHDGKDRHFSDKFSGFSIFVSYENKNVSQSLIFSRLLGDELLTREMHFSLHHSENIPGERRELLDSRRGIYRHDHLFVLRKVGKRPANRACRVVAKHEKFAP